MFVDPPPGKDFSADVSLFREIIGLAIELGEKIFGHGKDGGGTPCTRTKQEYTNVKTGESSTLTIESGCG